MESDFSGVRVAPISREKLEQADELSETWFDLIHDPDTSDKLLNSLRSCRRLLTDTWHNCHLISRLDKVCYLFDFDIIQSYLELDESVRDKKALLLHHIFHISSQDFAFPSGAFLELLEYLHRTLGRVTDRINEENNRRIAFFINPEETQQIVSDVLNAKPFAPRKDIRKVLSRLDSLLNSPRFRGVVNPMERKYIDDLTTIISLIPRTLKNPGEPREKRDRRDAENISHTIPSLHHALRSTHEPHRYFAGYILISFTNVVHSLPKRINNIDDIGDKEYADQLLSAIIGEFDLDFVLGERIYPWFVLSPEQIVTAERLGVHNDITACLNAAFSLRNHMRVISNYLEKRYNLVLDQDIRRLKNFDRKNYSRLRRTTRAIANSILSVEAGGTYWLMLAERTEQSVNRALVAQGHLNEDQQTEDNSVGDILKLITKLFMKMEAIPGFNYETEVSIKNIRRPYEEFFVSQRPSDTLSPHIVTGEKYSSGGELRYYAIRWEATCSTDEFLSAIKEVVIDPFTAFSNSETQKELKFRLLTKDDDSIWSEGVIVYTRDQAYGCTLPEITSNWESLRSENMGNFLREYNVEKGHKSKNSSSLAIEQYRINTRYGDFVYDIAPQEEQTFRHFTVISHVNLSNEIAYLLQLTSSWFIISTKFADTIHDVLKDFVQLQSAKSNIRSSKK